MHTSNSRRLIAVIGMIASLAIILSIIGLGPRETAAQASACSFSGYAWSDTIGWISLSGTNYGLQMDASGNVTGYAWSDNIGWVSANESGCPSGSCSPKVQSGSLTGWFKALAGGTSQSGGWDGWISLSGSSPAYGVSYNSSNGNFSGYAWGDANVGWVDFSLAQCGSATCTTNADCPANNTCTGGTCVLNAPSAPASLSASCPAPGTIGTFTWTASGGATSYLAYVHDDTAGTWLGHQDANSTSYTPATTASHVYTLTVSASNAAGRSATSTASAVTCAPAAPPPAPPNLTATCPLPGTSGTWTSDTVVGATNYLIYVFDNTLGVYLGHQNAASNVYSPVTTAGDMYSSTVSASNAFGRSATTTGNTVTCVAPTCPNGLNYSTYGPSCTCPVGKVQSGSICIVPPPTALLKVTPLLVQKGLTVNVSWTTTTTASCTVTATNGDTWSGTTGSHTSSPIVARTTYTLSCLGNDGSHLTQNASVNLLPVFCEWGQQGCH